MLTFSSCEGAKAAADESMSKQIGECLVRHYPGHSWMVEANSVSGVATIRLLYTDMLGRVSRFGCLAHLHKWTDALIMRLGGELLERYGLARGAARQDTAGIARQNGLILDGAIGKSRG